MVGGRFVQTSVPVIIDIRFRLRTESSWRTMDGEAGTKGTIAPGFAGAETCGGVMVRGPKSGDGARSPVYYLDSAGLVPPRPPARELYSEMDPLAAGMLADGSLAADPRIGGSWQGGGGRWLLWPLRVVLWGALLVIAFRGITAIVFNTASAPAGGGGTGPPSATGQFPVTLAEAYAAEFGRVYLSFSPQNQGQREQALTAFVPASVSAANPDLGWNGTGQLNLQAEQVAGITVQDPRHAVVTLLVLINGQLMRLGVPVAASGSGVVVSGEPAWLSAPPQTSPSPPALGRSDPAAQSQLMNELPAFFQAYANSDSAALNRFEVRGVSLTGLGGAVAFDSIGALHVPPGDATRQITVTVIWQLPDQSGLAAGNPGMTSKLEMAYSMSVVEVQSGKWYVKEIGATTEAVGAR
jgi:conjugative transposon protein TcpC